MKKLLTLTFAFLVSFSIFGRPKENPKTTDERISDFIIEEYKEMGYSIFPEVIIQDTLKKSNYEKYWEGKNGKLETSKPEYDDLYYNPKSDKQSKKNTKSTVQKIQEDTLYFQNEQSIIIQIENDNYYTSHFSYGRFYYPYWFNPYWYDPFDMIYDPFISFNSHFYWSFGFGYSPYYSYYTPWYNPYWHHSYYRYTPTYGHGGGENHNYVNIPQQRREKQTITTNHNGEQRQYAPVERRKLSSESRPAYHESRRTYSPSYNNPRMSVRPQYNNSKTERRIEYPQKSYSGGDARRSYSSGSNQNSYNSGGGSSSDRRSSSGGSYSNGGNSGGMRSSGSSNNSGGSGSTRR